MAITDIVKPYKQPAPNKVVATAVEYNGYPAYLHSHTTNYSHITLEGQDLIVGCALTPMTKYWTEQRKVGTKQVIQQVPTKAALAKVKALQEHNKGIENFNVLPYYTQEDLESVIVTVPDLEDVHHSEPVILKKTGKPIQVGDRVEVSYPGLPTIVGVLKSLEPLIVTTDRGDYCYRWTTGTTVRRA